MNTQQKTFHLEKSNSGSKITKVSPVRRLSTELSCLKYTDESYSNDLDTKQVKLINQQQNHLDIVDFGAYIVNIN